MLLPLLKNLLLKFWANDFAAIGVGVILSFLLSINPAYAQTIFTDVTETGGILPFKAASVYGSGVAAADYDNDGDIDLFVTTNQETPNQLYKNLGNGKFEEVGGEVGLDDSMNSRVALWFDFNGDHLLDLFVAGDCYMQGNHCLDSSVIKLYQQISPSRFIDVTEASGLIKGTELGTSKLVGGVAAGDIDNDGLLDLMLTYWNGEIHLFMNKGGTFSDIGSGQLTSQKALYWQSLLYDLNKDGLMDIYQNVDTGENFFWLNKAGGTFTEIGEETQLNTNFEEMGIALGDYDNDEDMDIYISNIRGSNTHNVLFRNDSGSDFLSFSEIAKDLQVHEGGWGWGVTFFDANNDGFLDLAANNGITLDWRMPPKFWLNDGSGGFSDASAEVGFVDDLDGTTLISLDFDRDGDLDLVESLKNTEGDIPELRLLKNQLENSEEQGNYLVVKPRMMGTNHFAIGSTVKIHMGDIILSRPILGGTSFYGQEPAEAFFGLGEKTHIDKVTVEWPGGGLTSKGNITANQIITITDKNLLHPPSHFRVTNIGSDQLTVDWSHISTTETGFLLQRSLSEDFESVIEFNLNDEVRSYEDAGLDLGTTYYYRIKAVNDTSTSEFSPIIEVLSENFLEAPDGLETTHLSHEEVSLIWQDNSTRETGFILQRSQFRDFTHFSEFQIQPDKTTFTDSGLRPRTKYYYRLKAVGENGESNYTPHLELNTPDHIPPTILEGNFDETGQVVLTWSDQGNNKEGYYLQRSVSREFHHTREFFLNKDVHRFNDSEVVPGTEFFYRIRAFNDETVSDFSNTFSIVVPSINPHLDSDSLSLFPNPTKGLFYFRLNNSDSGLVNIRITNMLGQVVFDEEYIKKFSSFQEVIKITPSPGVYIVTLSTKNTIYQKKIIFTN